MAKESPRRLLEACGRGDAAQVQTILSGSRVDVNADERGWTPAYVAAQNGHTAVLKALIGAGCDVNASREDGAAPALIAAEGPRETLEALVAAGCDVDHANGEGWTPALFAAQENQTEALGVLLRAGCDVNKAENDGWTPTAIAAQQGSTEALAMLLGASSDPNRAAHDGATPVYIAAQQGHVGCVDLLLRHGADCSAAAYDGATAVYIAAQKNFTDVLLALLRAGADVAAATAAGATPVYIAAERDCAEALTMLLSYGGDCNAANASGATPCYVAAQNGAARALAKGHADVVRALVAAGADVHAVTDSGATLVYIAAGAGHADVVAALLDLGGDPHRAKANGETACFAAAKQGHADCVGALIRGGVDVNQENEEGWTPVYMAAYNGHAKARAKALGALIAGGCDVDRPNKLGWTPACIAAQHGHLEGGQTLALKALIKAGADVNLAENDGWSPASLAAQNGETDCLLELIAAGADVNLAANDGASPLYIAAQQGQTAALNVLIANGALVDAATRDGATACCAAAEKGHVDALVRLVAAGADVNQAENDGWSPLAFAAQNGHADSIGELVAAGAAVDAAANDGATPCYIAAQQGQAHALAVLLAAKCDANAPNNYGVTPLLIAAQEGRAGGLLLGGAPSARDAGELSLRVSTGRRRGLRTVAIVACRGALLAARRAGCIAPDQRVVTLIWHKFKHADKVPSDMAYFDGYALVPSPRKRAAPVRAEAGDGVDAARSAAARAALERQHAALIKTGVVVFDMSASRRDAAPRRDGMKRLNHDRVLSHANDDVPADPARAALLVEALGPLATRTPLRDAARRRYLTTTDTFYVSKRALEAALARGDDDAGSDYDVGGRERRKFHVTKEQFDVLCREVATPRGDEIWAEAMAGLLLPLAPIWVSSEDEWREPGDVREGDVAALDLPPSLKPAGVLATHFDAFGTTIFPALAVLDDLAHPRDGEADGAAGAARAEAAIASLLTAERLPPLKAGDAVRVLDDRDADWREAGFTDGQWSDATFVKFDDSLTAVVKVGDEDEEVLFGAIQRRYYDAPPAAKLLTLAVMDGRNDVVARLLRPGGIDHALMYAVPTDAKSRFDPRATALDRAIAKGNSVAAALLVNQYSGGASFVPHACNSVRREKHLMGNFSIRLEGEFLRARAP
ncbi:hypothetical protein JL720_1196 [Aureococcus anophagefferens]|nr:hypothetical protein JL720_1196 [Aureococcus anophagefferens]